MKSNLGTHLKLRFSTSTRSCTAQPCSLTRNCSFYYLVINHACLTPRRIDLVYLQWQKDNNVIVPSHPETGRLLPTSSLLSWINLSSRTSFHRVKRGSVELCFLIPMSPQSKRVKFIVKSTTNMHRECEIQNWSRTGPESRIWSLLVNA